MTSGHNNRIFYNAAKEIIYIIHFESMHIENESSVLQRTESCIGLDDTDLNLQTDLRTWKTGI